MATTPDKPMDSAQLSQRVVWLDDERRRDHAELARLAQEIASTMAVLKDQVVKMRETGERLTSVESTLTRLPRLEDAITAARSDLMPLRDADIRLQDDILRQGKDFRAQSDQTARLWSEINGRLETVARTVDGLSHRMQTLDTQRKEHADRVGELAARLDVLNKAADGLAGRVQLQETQRKEHADRVGELATRLDVLNKAADGLAGRLQLLGTRDRDRNNREAAIQAQLSRLDASQSQAIEDVKRSVARVDTLITDIERIRREIVLAQEEDAKRRRNDAASMSEQQEALAGVQRQVADIAQAQEAEARRHRDELSNQAEQKEAMALLQRQSDELVESAKSVAARLERAEEAATLAVQLAGRLAAAEEQLSMLQATYRGLQEVEDKHWGTDIPQMQHMVEEASAACANSASTVQELIAASQGLKEAVRELQVNLASEHVYSDALAAALRGLIEEDLQSRLAATQKQLQALRRLVNAPVHLQVDQMQVQASNE